MTPRSLRRSSTRVAAALELIAFVFAFAPACSRDRPEPPARPSGDSPALPQAPVPVPAPVVNGRQYALRLLEPARTEPAPLVILLHGFGDTGASLEAAWHMRAAAAAHGILLAVPEGTPDADGNRFWNASKACCDFRNTGVDDIAYIDALLVDVAKRAAVDPKQVHIVGFSNGAFLAHRYACERASRVASIVSIAGAGPNPDPSVGDVLCAPSEPVSILQIHGDADAMVHFEGGAVGGRLPRRAPYPSVAVSLAPWRAHDACAPAVAGLALDLETALPGNETSVDRAACARDTVVELWTVHGGGHSMRVGDDWAPRIFDFVAAHPKR